jgi:hypothetical protein
MADTEKKDETVIEIPKGYEDAIFQYAHQAVKGENVVTCRLDIREPLKKLDTKVACEGCGGVFTLVESKA